MALNLLIGILLVLGIMILVHEWGHFIAARLFGVRVDVFSVGFGPRLFGRKVGATDYRVSALPLGGYVRMAGQDIYEADSGDQAPTGAPDELLSKPRWQRAVISFAGPLVNLILPLPILILLFVLFGVPYSTFLDKPVEVLTAPTAAGPAPPGLQIGDRVVSVNGVPTPTWEKLLDLLSRSSGGSVLHVKAENAGVKKFVDVPAGEKPLDGFRSVFGEAPRNPTVDRVEPGKPAERSGVRRDDRIVSVNGRTIYSSDQFRQMVRQSEGKPLTFVLARAGKTVTLDISPVQGTGEGGEKVWLVGLLAGDEVAYRRVGFGEGVRDAAVTTVNITGEVLRIVGKLITGGLSLKQLQGVVGIARESGEAVSRGASSVLFLMVQISINLGILNLLPIPILDGGHILLLSIEGIRRRDLSLRFKERFVQVGLVFLLLLFAFVMYNDVARMIPHH